MEFLPELTNGRNGSSKPAAARPSRVRLPTSPIPLESPALPPLVQKLSSLPPPLLVKTPCPDLTISVRNTDTKERERPPSLQLGPLNGALINKVGNPRVNNQLPVINILPLQKMERLDNILKSVATAAVVQITTNIKEEEQEETEEPEAEVKPPQKTGARRQTLPTLPFKGEDL